MYACVCMLDTDGYSISDVSMWSFCIAPPEGICCAPGQLHYDNTWNSIS